MVAKLYHRSRLLRDNFIQFVEKKFYNSLLFHRIVNQFMIQGGDPTSKMLLMQFLPEVALPPVTEVLLILTLLIFKKGALAVARDNNAEKASSKCHFYIVQGRAISQQYFDKICNERLKGSDSSSSIQILKGNV